MTTNAIDCVLFGLLILTAIVQAGAVLVILRTAWDKKPLPQESFRKALAIGLARQLPARSCTLFSVCESG